MPSLAKLLEDSMPFAAGRGDSHATIREITGRSLRVPKPDPTMPEDVPPELRGDATDADIVASNFIWQFDHDPETPASFRNLRVLSRGMGMKYKQAAPVCKHVEFEDLLVTYADGRGKLLPLTPEFVAGAWHIAGGKLADNATPWWRLETNTDQSVLVAFVYEERDGDVFPLSREEIDALGDSFMPGPDVPRYVEIICKTNTTMQVCVGNTRHVALVSLTTCRERPDFVDANFMGFARFYPHMMFQSTNSLATAEVRIRLERPAHAMTHGDPEMEDDIKALLVTDSNRNHSLTAWIPGMSDAPIPLTSNIYDYYLVDPDRTLAKPDPENPLRHKSDHAAQQPREVSMADARMHKERTLTDCASRDGGKWEDVLKVPYQGQFDNIHLAPRMKIEFRDFNELTGGDGNTVNLDDIAMVFACVHDCVHMHVRWAAFAKNKGALGFVGQHPNAVAGRPAVPENQSVFASFPNRHTLDYRAIAEAVEPGHWQVFCHHGAAYVIDVWPTLEAANVVWQMRFAVFEADRVGANEIFPTMPETWAAFYWRCRWTENRLQPGRATERLRFHLQKAMR
jgi:hypothetical protein